MEHKLALREMPTPERQSIVLCGWREQDLRSR